MASPNYDIVYPHSNNCFEQEKQLNRMKNDMDYYFNDLKPHIAYEIKEVYNYRKQVFDLMQCPKIVNEKRVSDTGEVLDKYSEIAKVRIESISYRTRAILVGIGTFTILASLVIIIKSKKK